MKIRNLPYIFVYAILIIYAIITLIPFLWTVLSSFKTYAEIVGREFTFLPKTWTLGNYKYLLGSEPLFLRWIFNSVFIGLSVTFLNVLFNTMCGYALARLSFRGKSILLYVIILILAVPNQILMIPSYVILYNLGWIDDYKAMIIPSMINATYIFMMRQFFINFPKDVEEAAAIDGLNRFQILFFMAFPIAKPAIATQSILIFLGSGNDFMKPLLYLSSKENFTLTVGLKYFQTQYYTYWNYVMAAAVISVIPILILYIILNKYFMDGMRIGGDK